jgi:hypothetical protein
MKTQKAVIEGILHFTPSEFEPNGGRYGIYQFDMSDYGHIPIKEVRAEFDVPVFEPRELLVTKLQKDRQQIIDEATKKAAAIEEKIQQLLALTQGAAE